MWTIFKVFIEFVTILQPKKVTKCNKNVTKNSVLQFVIFGPEACGVLAP